MAQEKLMMVPFGTSIDVDLDTEFREELARRKMKIQPAIDEAIRMWLGKDENEEQLLARQFLRWKNGQHEEAASIIVQLALNQIRRYSK